MLERLRPGQRLPSPWLIGMVTLHVAFCMACGVAHADNDAERISASAARVRALPPHVPVAGAFMILHNAGSREVRLTGAESPVATGVELHTHRVEDGMMAMRRIPEMVIKAGGSLVLEPSGHHLMLIGLKEPLKAGAAVPLTLTFADGSHRRVEAIVGNANAPRSAARTH